MQSLFIGQTYIDVTFLADRMPQGDEKSVASEYAVSFGGNAVTAAFCCAKLGAKPDLIATIADDWLGNMFLDMAAKYDVRLHTRQVEKSSLSFIMPKNGKRAIVRCRDDHYLSPFPVLELDGCRALHRDGGGTLLPADGQDAGGDARLPQEPTRQDWRRHARRTWRALVRRERRGPD